MIFSAPLPLSVSLLLWESTPLHLSSTLPSPRLPRLLKCVLARDPCLWQPECYTCAQNPARHKMAARQASPPEMSTAVCICRVCVSRVRTVFLWRVSVRVCKCLRARNVHRHCQKKKESFPNYVANLIHTVCVCACVFRDLVGTEWVSCQKMRGWVRESVCECFSDYKIQARNTLGRGETSQALRNFLAEPDFCCHYP